MCPSPILICAATWMPWPSASVSRSRRCCHDRHAALKSEPAEVWITGIGLATSLGEGLDANWDALNAGRINVDEKNFAPYVVHPWTQVNLDTQIPKKGDQRQMEAWQRIGTYAAGLALESAGVKGDKEILGRMDMVDRRRRRRARHPRRHHHPERQGQGQCASGLSQRAPDERSAPDAVPGAALQPARPATSPSCTASAAPPAPSWARKRPASTRRGSRWRASRPAKATSR